MKPKSQSELKAAGTQVEYLTEALSAAGDSSGYWLNTALRTSPRIYPKGPTISPFNALILALFADKNGYRTSQYTFFQDAKSRGESVLEKEHGVPFNWYNWNQYVNLYNPQETITRNQYLLLSPEDKEMYKGVHNREIRILFNIDQTMLPQVDNKKYDQILDHHGTLLDRGYIKGEEHQLQNTVNQFTRQMKEHLVPIRKDATSMAYYNTEKDAIYMPNRKYFIEYEDYVQELMRQLVSATGHQQRLAREGMVMKGGKAPSGDALKYERLVTEMASAVKMLELGTRCRLASENLPLVDYWTRELKENPCLIDTLESDVNNALEVIRRAEKGEKIEYATLRNRQQTEEMLEKQKLQVDSKECTILLDIIRQGGMRIADENFTSPQEKAAFLEKFSLEHYEEQKNYALRQTTDDDSEIVEEAYTEALINASRIEDACREYLPNEWNAKGHYLIANIVKNIPNRDERLMAIVKDHQSGIVDVILPAGALGGGQVVLQGGESRPFRQTPDEVMPEAERTLRNAKVTTNDIQGFSKQRIEKALMKDGATYVRFFNNDGSLGYHPDDSYFATKDLTIAKLNGWKLETQGRYDVMEAVEQTASVQFDRIQMLKDDNNQWTLYLKPQNESSFSIYPLKDDLNRFFSTIRQGRQVESEQLRVELAHKYYALGSSHPELQVNLFGEKAKESDAARITRVNIYKNKDGEFLCAPVFKDVEKVEPRSITASQWQRLWLSDDVAAYKQNLAASLFADILHPQMETAQSAGIRR